MNGNVSVDFHFAQRFKLGLELRDDRRDVVVLLLETEAPNTIHDCV